MEAWHSCLQGVWLGFSAPNADRANLMRACRSGVEWDPCLHAACLWTGMVSIPEPQPLHAGGAHAGGNSIAQGRHPQCAAGCWSRLCCHSVRAWAPARHNPLSGEAVHSKLSFRGLSLCDMPDVALTARAGSAASVQAWPPTGQHLLPCKDYATCYACGVQAALMSSDGDLAPKSGGRGSSKRKPNDWLWGEVEMLMCRESHSCPCK